MTSLSWQSWYITLLPTIRAGAVLLLSSIGILVAQELKLWMVAIILTGTVFNPLANSSLSKNYCNVRLVIECSLISGAVLILFGFDLLSCLLAILIAIVLAGESYYRFELLYESKRSSLATSVILNIATVCVLALKPEYQLMGLLFAIAFIAVSFLCINGIGGLFQRIKYSEAAASILIGASGQAAVYLIAIVISMRSKEQVDGAYFLALASIVMATVIQRALLKILNSPSKIRRYIARARQASLAALFFVPFLLFLKSEQSGMYVVPLFSIFSVTGYLFYLEGVRGGQSLMLAKCSIAHLLIVLVVTALCLQQGSMVLAPLYLVAPLIRNVFWGWFLTIHLSRDQETHGNAT